MRPSPRSEPRPIRGSLALFLVANALPLAAVVALFVLERRGEVRIRALPDEGVGLVVALGAVLAAIVGLGWVAYPALASVRGAVRARFRAARKRMREAGALETVGLVPVVVGWGAVLGFLWVDVVLVASCLLALAASEVGLLVALAVRLRNR